ncbi:MAG: hypothetical protein MJZ99_00010 [Bacteroidales bacterium]|nr:hypothetical protein [Bacteroidales bacterium]
MTRKFQIIIDTMDEEKIACLTSEIGDLNLVNNISLIVPKGVGQIYKSRRSLLSEIWKSTNPMVEVSEEKLQELKNGEGSIKIIEDFPNALYILDVAKEVAEKISKSYGVLCVTWDELPKTIEYLEQIKYYHTHYKDNTKWCDIVGDKDRNTNICSNSLLIVDKYFFSRFSERSDRIIEGLLDLIECFVDNSFGSNYNVWIIYDPLESLPQDEKKQIKYKKKKLDKEKQKELNEMNSTIEKEIKNQIKNYNIKCIPISSSQCGDLFHDRKVFSPYFQITATHYLNNLKNDQEVFCIFPFHGVRRGAPKEAIPLVQSNVALEDIRCLLSDNGIKEVDLPLFKDICRIDNPIVEINEVEGKFAKADFQGREYRILNDGNDSEKLEQGDRIQITSSRWDDKTPKSNRRFAYPSEIKLVYRRSNKEDHNPY